MNEAEIAPFAVCRSYVLWVVRVPPHCRREKAKDVTTQKNLPIPVRHRWEYQCPMIAKFYIHLSQEVKPLFPFSVCAPSKAPSAHSSFFLKCQFSGSSVSLADVITQVIIHLPPSLHVWSWTMRSGCHILLHLWPQALLFVPTALSYINWFFNFEFHLHLSPSSRM